MGISIDKAIENLNEIIEEGWLISDMEKCTAIDACELAIDIMRKYQKIEQIVNSNPDYIHHTDMDTYKLNSIREVTEDDTRENQCAKGEY